MAAWILQQRFYITAIVLFGIGFATLCLHPNLIKKIIGLNLMDTSVFLFLASMGYVQGGTAPMVEQGTAGQYINPVPGGLVLTGIVVAVSTTALFLALTHRLYLRYHSVNLDEILMLARREQGERR